MAVDLRKEKEKAKVSRCALNGETKVLAALGINAISTIRLIRKELARVVEKVVLRVGPKDRIRRTRRIFYASLLLKARYARMAMGTSALILIVRRN